MLLAETEQRHPSLGEQRRRIPQRAENPENDAANDHGEMVEFVMNMLHRILLEKRKSIATEIVEGRRADEIRAGRRLLSRKNS
jgi:hypothetical protein